MTKTDIYIRTMVQENTESNLSKVLELLTEITHEEHYYNHELSNTTHNMRLEIVEILKEVYKDGNRFKSVLDD